MSQLHRGHVGEARKQEVGSHMQKMVVESGTRQVSGQVVSPLGAVSSPRLDEADSSGLGAPGLSGIGLLPAYSLRPAGWGLAPECSHQCSGS